MWRATRTLASGFVGAPGLCGPRAAAGTASWCTAGQPAWSAFRQPAFGFGTLDVVNATHLLWTWHACAPCLLCLPDPMCCMEECDCVCLHAVMRVACWGLLAELCYAALPCV